MARTREQRAAIEAAEKGGKRSLAARLEAVAAETAEAEAVLARCRTNRAHLVRAGIRKGLPLQYVADKAGLSKAGVADFADELPPRNLTTP